VSWGPLQPARIDFSDPRAPSAPGFGDRYLAPVKALAQAKQVYLTGNGLPGRWAGRQRFVVLETGFGLGHNFLATWAAWQADAQRCDQLWYLALDKHPPRREDLAQAHAHSPLPEQAAALQAAWPPLTPDMHLLRLDSGRVNLLLAWGDIAGVLPEWLAQVDAFCLDGFAPERNPAMWDPWRLRQLPRLAAPGATVATWNAAEPVRQGLRAAGFVLTEAPDASGRHAKTVGHFAPRFASPPPLGRAVAAAVRQAKFLAATMQFNGFGLLCAALLECFIFLLYRKTPLFAKLFWLIWTGGFVFLANVARIYISALLIDRMGMGSSVMIIQFAGLATLYLVLWALWYMLAGWPLRAKKMSF